MVTAALKDPQVEVRACALEALMATDADYLRRIADRPLIEALLRIKGIEREYVTRRVTSLLRRLAPGGLVQHLDQGRAWWKGVKRTYRPQPWPPPNPPRARKRERRTVAYPRRVDFDKTGIDVMFVIDSSDSMSSRIEAARLAVLGLERLLSGLSRSLRAGVVTYCGPHKFPGGAIVLGDLGPGRTRLRRFLGELRIGGGQEGGESVTAGLALAVRAERSWRSGSYKLLVLIGDELLASPGRAHDLVRRTHRLPLTKIWNDPTVPPGPSFVLSTICAARLGPDRKPTLREYALLAEEGGGESAALRVWGSHRPETYPSLVRPLLLLAYGGRWRPQIPRFLEIYERYWRLGVISHW